jgi:hypothetical protein
MAFDTVASHTLTGADVITEALELLGVLGDGDTTSATQLASSLRTLNNLIKLWSADTAIYAQDEYTLNLTTTGVYTLGVSNVGYIPNKVVNATRYSSTTFEEVPINPLSQEEWYALADKTTTGPVTQYYAKRNAVGVDMDFLVWPVPADTTYDLKLWLQYPIRDITVGTEDLFFTQEWYLALSYGLAYLLAPKYGVIGGERQQLGQDMERFREEASSYDVDGSVFLQPRTQNG